MALPSTLLPMTTLSVRIIWQATHERNAALSHDPTWRYSSPVARHELQVEVALSM
jgi:hypothetical protein